MLERLARWLRALGVDVAGAAGESDAALVRRALAEGRTLLTCDRRLPREHAACPCLVVPSVAPLEQLREVVAHAALVPRRDALFTRCLICNVPLESAPGRPLDWHCPRCGRVYWEGSHTRRMRAALRARAYARSRAGGAVTGGVARFSHYR